MRGDSRQNISRAIEIKNVTVAPDKVKYKTVLSYTYSIVRNDGNVWDVVV